MAYIKQAFIYEILKQYNRGEISFGRFCELINEEAKRDENTKEILDLIDRYWKFDNDQTPVSNWHDKQDLLEAVRKALCIHDVSNRALWRIEPYFDGISTAVTTYKVVDQNGTLQYMGDRNQCEYFLQHGC
jgi:hypothetical protein